MKYLVVFLITILMISCSGLTDKQMLDSGKKYLNESKFNDAAETFKDLIDDYPDSKYVKNAYFELGSLYHNKALKDVTEKVSLQKGIYYYEKVVNKFPESEEAPKALFMIAFIQANQLSENDSAKSNYELFLKKYPEHHLAMTAKIELENVGLSPEAILSKKLSEQKN